MSKALYTKYRPQTFEEVIGQEVAVQILKKSIETERVNHAYLFYGIRGTGKTTLARLFAKTINCERPVNSSPCNICDSCKSVNTGAQIDVIEMDAASNNGVDEIRDLTEKANYATTSSKYKVYIIDEVHMLTKSAFNALLKTLEEPPQNTIFLLATTEINKIPDTILSRNVVLNMQLVKREEVIKQLENILNTEGKVFEHKALEYIATLSEGSVRDAISYLQTSLLYNDEVTKENVIKVLGIVDMEKLEEKLLIGSNEVSKLIDESVNGRRLMIIMIDLLIKLISEGGNEFKQLLSKLTEGFIAIKDPMLLNKFIISVLMETEVVGANIEEVIEETIEAKIEQMVEEKVSIQDILRIQQEEGTREARIMMGDTVTEEFTQETQINDKKIAEALADEVEEITKEQSINIITDTLHESTDKYKTTEFVSEKSTTLDAQAFVEGKKANAVEFNKEEFQEETVEQTIEETKEKMIEDTVEQTVEEALTVKTVEQPSLFDSPEKTAEVHAPIKEEFEKTEDLSQEQQLEEITQEIRMFEKPVDEKAEPEVAYEPFHFDSKDYVWSMLNGGEMKLASIKNKFLLLRTADVTGEEREIVNLLLESTPLIATEQSIILGMKDNFLIEELKKHINRSSMKKLLEKTLGEAYIMMPTNVENWEKLINVATQVKEQSIDIEFSLNKTSFFREEEDKEAELARNLFGDKLIKENE